MLSPATMFIVRITFEDPRGRAQASASLRRCSGRPQRDQTWRRYQIQVIEIRGNLMRYSHLPGAPAAQPNGTLGPNRLH